MPQIILDESARTRKLCRIVVTQPRRIAARSVAGHVCKERDWELGSICGYKVSMDKKYKEAETRIVYVTTGFLLQSIISNRNELVNYTHVVLDEIHDSDMDTDLLLLLIKVLLKQNYMGKIVLMSATLDPEQLLNYFKEVEMNKNVGLVTCELR